MLGQLTVVEAFPGARAVPGPHGIPLLAHARAGGEPAVPVFEYLERIGGADGPTPEPLSDTERDRYVGAYRFGSGASDVLDVTIGPRGLMIGQRDDVARGLVHLGDHAFHPSGSPGVWVRFEVAVAPQGPDAPATAIAIHDPDPLIRGVRAD